MKSKATLLKLAIVIYLTSIVSAYVFASCQWNAEHLNDNYKLELPAGKKLVNVTWKNNKLWYLTRDMHEDEIPETYQLQEESKFGIIKDNITIIETK